MIGSLVNVKADTVKFFTQSGTASGSRKVALASEEQIHVKGISRLGLLKIAISACEIELSSMQ